MNPRFLKRLLAIALGALCGLVIAKSFPQNRDPAHASDPSRAPALTENSPTAPTLPRATGRTVKNVPKDMPSLQEKIRIDPFFVARARFSLLELGSFNLNREFSDRFGLSPQQRQATGEATRQLFTDLREIELKHARIVTNEKGEEVIEIPPSAEANTRRDDFIEQVADLLPDPAKGRDLARLIALNPRLAASGYTQHLSVDERTGSDGKKSATLKRLTLDESGHLIDAVWFGLSGGNLVDGYRPVLSAFDKEP